MAIGVNIKYYIPEDEYQYTKLTYKKDLIPESVNDGTIVNLDPTSDQQIVNDLEEGQVYYFIIYTDKSESPYVKYESPQDDPNTPFKEMIEIQKQVGEDEFRTVHSWFGKWGKLDDIQIVKYGVVTETNNVNIQMIEQVDKYKLVQQQEDVTVIESVSPEVKEDVITSETVNIIETISQETTTNPTNQDNVIVSDSVDAEIVTEEE